MILWRHVYIFTFLLAAIISLVITPVFQKLAEKTDFMDRPKKEDHKRHAKAIPLLGGAAMFTAWAGAILAGIIMIFSWNSHGQMPPALAAYVPNVTAISGRLFFICLGAFLAMLLGLLDDRFGMSAKLKLLGQIVVAIIAVTLGGVQISVFINHQLVTWVISIFWFVLIINAINFFDNMDGLAVGTSAIAMMFFTITAAINQQYFIATLAALSTGVATGFWFYNHSPATIFMGDSGSHFLGYMLAVLSSSVTYFSHDTSLTRLPILIPMFILAIPLFDSLAVVMIRLKNKKPIYIGDHNHISHRFVKMGMSRKRAVQLVHLLEVIIGLSVLPLLWGDLKTALVILAQALLMLLLVSLLHYSVKGDFSTDETEN